MGHWGIFQEMTTIFNRAPVEVSVRFDGMERTIPPGESIMPKVAVPYARKQNPIMGSGSYLNPTGSGYSSLIVDMQGKNKHLAKPLTDEEWAAHLGAPCLVNVEEIEEEKGIKLTTGRKKNRPVMASGFEAREGVSMTGHDELSGHDGGE